MEALVENSLLYDFYGGLLTEKQQRIMNLYYNEDWNMVEIAEKEGVSRQAVHDLIHRSGRLLKEYEVKLGLMERFLKQQELLQSMKLELSELLAGNLSEVLSREKLTGIQDKVNKLMESDN